jgi:S-adenosylmethionine decarboxylase
MRGLHLIADLSGCSAIHALHWDAPALLAHCRRAVETVGLHAVGDVVHSFGPAGSGVTGVVLLAESHLAVHTWPELGAVTIDVYVCNFGQDNSAKAHELLRLIEEPFAAQQAQRHQVLRGALPFKASEAATRSPAS